MAGGLSVLHHMPVLSHVYTVAQNRPPKVFEFCNSLAHPVNFTQFSQKPSE